MARNQEKAQSMLYRFREAMRIESGQKRHPKDRTPLLPATTTSIAIAEAARKDALKEINRLIARVQDRDAELPLVRAVNEDINERVARVRAWDERIRELGGLSRRAQRRLDELEGALLVHEGLPDLDGGLEDDALLAINGFYYFGRARELPEAIAHVQGQRALQREAHDAALAVARLAALQARLDPATYYRDAPVLDAVLCAEEASFVRALALNDPAVAAVRGVDWITGRGYGNDVRECANVDADVGDVADVDANADTSTSANTTSQPSQAQVEAFLIERRKQELLAKYT